MSFIKTIIKIANAFEYKIAQDPLADVAKITSAPTPVSNYTGTARPGSATNALQGSLNRLQSGAKVTQTKDHVAKAPVARQQASAQATTPAPAPGVHVADGTKVKGHDKTRTGAQSLGQVWEAKVNATKDPKALQGLLNQRIADLNNQKLDPAYKQQLIQKAKAMIQSKTGTRAPSTAVPVLNTDERAEAAKQNRQTRGTLTNRTY